jgi:transcriptional regulator with XRE-family HTH domain
MPRRAGPASLARGLGRRIRALRKEAGVTQERLAWACDLNKGYMSQLEAGKHTPSVPVLYALAKRLGVDLGDLVCYDLGRPHHRLLDALRRGDLEAARRVLAELADLAAR